MFKRFADLKIACILQIVLVLQLDADLITIRQDLDAITSILYQTFEIATFKRNYDAIP